MTDSILSYGKDAVILIIGAIISYVIAAITSKRKIPMSYNDTRVLINSNYSNISDLEIKYKEARIENLACGYWVYWNNGKEAIRSDDVAGKITLSVPDGFHFYHADVIESSSDTNKFAVRISNDKKSMNISFKYLNYQQGGLVYYISDCNDYRKYTFNNHIIGLRSAASRYTNSNNIFRLFVWYLYLFSLPIGGFLLGAVFFGSPDSNTVFYILFFLWLLIIIASRWMLYKMNLGDIISKIPKNFREYFTH